MQLCCWPRVCGSCEGRGERWHRTDGRAGVAHADPATAGCPRHPPRQEGQGEASCGARMARLLAGILQPLLCMGAAWRSVWKVPGLRPQLREGRVLLGAQLHGGGFNPAWAGSTVPRCTAERLKDRLVLASRPRAAPSAWSAQGGHGSSPALPLPACSVGLAQALTPVDVTAVLADLSDFNVPALRGHASPPGARRQRFPLPVGLRCPAAAHGAPCSWGWQLPQPRESTEAAAGCAAVDAPPGKRGGKRNRRAV